MIGSNKVAADGADLGAMRDGSASQGTRDQHGLADMAGKKRRASGVFSAGCLYVLVGIEFTGCVFLDGATTRIVFNRSIILAGAHRRKVCHLG